MHVEPAPAVAALNNLGYDIGRTTVQRILAEHGIEPAPGRKRQYSWATFIKAHLGAIVGMDFFTVEALTVVGLVRFHVPGSPGGS